MRESLQFRIPKWQHKELGSISEESEVSMANLARFAINYLLANYDGQINSEVLDEMEFKARKKVSK